MELDFDLNKVSVTEFGVGRKDDGDSVFRVISVDDEVKKMLLEMAQTTMKNLKKNLEGANVPAAYNPAEKHAGTEYLTAAAGGPFGLPVRELHDAENLDFDHARLSNLETVFCYFARFTDTKKRRLTAVRRGALQFKVLQNRVIYLDDDSLRIMKKKAFKLDGDFDLLSDSACIHIWRPKSFELLCNLQQAIRDAVPRNVAAIAADLPFVDFDGIEIYASSHSRAAGYLVSIRSQVLRGIKQPALMKLCKDNGVDTEHVDGKVTVSRGHEMGFLEVLDRRRYRLDLTPQSERFRAKSRVRIQGS